MKQKILVCVYFDYDIFLIWGWIPSKIYLFWGDGMVTETQSYKISFKKKGSKGIRDGFEASKGNLQKSPWQEQNKIKTKKQ